MKNPFKRYRVVGETTSLADSTTRLETMYEYFFKTSADNYAADLNSIWRVLQDISPSKFSEQRYFVEKI